MRATPILLAVTMAIFALLIPAWRALAQCQVTHWQRDYMWHHSLSLFYLDVIGRSALYDSDPWSWDGTRWERLGNLLPPSTSLGALVPDRARNRLVAVGANGPAGYGTMEWDAVSWTTPIPGGPIGREGATAAFHAALGRVVLVGGRESMMAQGDAWAWDGASWTQVPTTGLTPRWGHRMIFDEARGRMVLFGGRVGSGQGTATTETWELTGDTWSLVVPATALSDATFHYDSRAGRVIAVQTHPTPRVWAWDGAAWTVIDSPTFKARQSAGVAFDRARGMLVVSGGTETTSLPGSSTVKRTTDVWEWDGQTWAKVYEPSIPVRAYHAMAYDDARGQMIAFGGVDTWNGPALDQTLIYDGVDWAVLPVQGPPPRTRATMAWDEARQVIVLHGGLSAGNKPLRDTWTWNGTAWAQVASDGPITKGPVMAYDPAGARCLVAPGNGEVWSWNGSAWAVESGGGPLADNHCVAFDPARGRLVVDHIGVWKVGEWDGTTWHEVTPQMVRLISEAGMVHDPRSGRLVRAGGMDAGDAFITWSGHCWEWDGQLWRFAQGLPLGRIGHAMAWDAHRQRVVNFGGLLSTQVLGDTWSSVISGNQGPGIWSNPVGGSARPGQGITVKVETFNSWMYPYSGFPETYQWFHNGRALTDGVTPIGVVNGATQRLMHIGDLASPAHGLIHVVISNPCQSVTSEAVPITINCPADMTTHARPGLPAYGTPNGVVNNDDFFYYIARFAAGSVLECDLTTTGATQPGTPNYRLPDGTLNADDFGVYLTLLAQGC